MRALLSEEVEVDGLVDDETLAPCCFPAEALACLAIVAWALWNKRDEVSSPGTRTYGRRTVFDDAAGMAGESRSSMLSMRIHKKGGMKPTCIDVHGGDGVVCVDGHALRT
jgi:hypothetical protein